jgi:DNA-binding transcriptional LysR family regulator
MMWSAVELRDIRVFLTLAEELHFARTAERLQLTPSRVSQIIRSLEQKLGGRLVQRTSRRVELTPLGERFREEVADAYEQLTGVLGRMDVFSREREGPLRLHLFSDPGVSQISRIVRAFEHAYPGRVVEATEVPLDDPFGPLRRGEVDVMASWLPHGQAGMVTGPILSSEPRVAAVAADHPLAGRDRISIEELAEFRVMRFTTMPDEFNAEWIPSHTPSGRRIPHQPFSDQSLGDRGRMTNELVHQIATGRIVHPTVPSFANMFGHPDIVYVPIADMRPLRSALVWRHDTTNRQVHEFAQIAEDIAGRPDDSADPARARASQL